MFLCIKNNFQHSHLCWQHTLLHKCKPPKIETRNTYTIRQCPGAKHTTESLIKITGSITQNTERTVANTTQEKPRKTRKTGTKTKRQMREAYSLPTPYFILILIKIY
jgi:hypothetical protein